MEKKNNFRIHSFILFLVLVVSGGYVVYLQVLIKSDDIVSKLISLFVFMVSLYLATKNWVKDNPEKNKKNWNGLDED